MSRQSKVLLALGSLLVVSILATYFTLSHIRENDKTTIQNMWECHGIGNSLDRESDYSILYNTCVTSRINEDGSVTKVMANLDVGLEM